MEIDNESEKKVFVGNVPYSCTQDEFYKTFSNVKGFVKAEISFRHNNYMCRGFGFVTLDSVENAELLKKRTDMVIHDRELRLTNYNTSYYDGDRTTKTYHIQASDRYNYLFVDSLPDGSDKQYLKDLFSGFRLGKYFVKTDIDTGEPKTSGMVEILDYSKYRQLLMKGYINDKNNNTVKIYKWRVKQYKKKDKKVTQHDLFRAFNAGRNLGLIEGHRMAKRNTNLIE